MNPYTALCRLDALVMGRVFTPVAHWADYRWHVNHFRLALLCLKVGLVCFVGGAFQSFVRDPSWLGAVSVAVTGLNIWTCQGWLRDLGKASEAYERDPCKVPRSAIGFVIFPAGLRALFSMICISMYAAFLPMAVVLGSVGLGVQMVYLPLMAAMYYFAGIIPSGRARRPKRERAPAGLEPVPAR